MLSAKPG